MQTPLVSIVLTTHDAYERYLERAIRSVLDQTFRNFELIVVKDGGPRSVVAQTYAAADSRVRYQHQDLRSGNDPRPKNEGTLAAAGELIAYLDADNTYRPDHLATLYDALVRTDADVAYGDRVVRDEPGGTSMAGIARDFSFATLVRHNYIDTSDLLCRKGTIDAVGGWDEELAYHVDWNLCVRMAKNGATFTRVPAVLTDYVQHGGNKSHGLHKTRNFDVWGCKLWPDVTSYGPRPPLKVAVYTVRVSGCVLVQRALASLREKTCYPFDHYVLNRGPADDTAAWLRTMERTINLRLFTNELLDDREYDVIIKVDDTCELLSQGWLETIVDLYERSRFFIVSASADSQPAASAADRYARVGPHRIRVAEYLDRACIAAPARAYRDCREDGEQSPDGLAASLSQAMRHRSFVCGRLEDVRCRLLPAATELADLTASSSRSV